MGWILELIAEKQRKEMARSDAARDNGLRVPEHIECQRDISYGKYGDWNLLDIYRPDFAEGRLPVIINVHGGGFFYGTKETYQFYGMDLAMRGFAVVNFNYRLSPAARFPAPLEDLNEVLGWVVKNAEQQRLDVGNVFLVGDSAGAQLVNQYCTILHDSSYAKSFPFMVAKGFTVRAVAMNCGMYDIAKVDQILLRFVLFTYARWEYVRGSKRLDVVGNMNHSYPPSFVATAYHDYVYAYAAPMARRIEELGVDCEYRVYGAYEKKEIGHVFHLDIRSEEAKKCNDEECCFFRKYLV